jgi:hypothetical protein
LGAAAVGVVVVVARMRRTFLLDEMRVGVDLMRAEEGEVRGGLG